MELIEFNNRVELYNYAYNLIRQLRPQTIGLCGGNTPFPLYQMLKGNIKVKAFQLDERYTNDLTELNQIKISESFDNFFAFNTSLPIEKSRLEYEKTLEENLNQSLDIAILGIGVDGHFASLFQDYEDKTSKVLITKAPDNYKSTNRLTINKHIIMKSKFKIILLVGKEKMGIIKKIKSKSGAIFPASIFKDDKNTIILYSND